MAAESLVDADSTFSSLGLDARLLQGVAKLGFAHPTLVQAKAIPLALEGKDILARAKTGSGKTAAYLLPVLQSVLKSKEVCIPQLRFGVVRFGNEEGLTREAE